MTHHTHNFRGQSPRLTSPSRVARCGPEPTGVQAIHLLQIGANFWKRRIECNC